MKKFTLFLIVVVLSVVMASMVENVTAAHTSSATSTTVTEKECKLYKYTYNVTNNSTSADNIVEIVISKTTGAEVRWSKNINAGWQLISTDGTFKITSTNFNINRILPGKSRIFVVYSTMEPKAGTLTTTDNKLGTSGPWSVWVPDDKTRPGIGTPHSDFYPLHRYNFTLSCVSGNVYHLVIFLDPLVAIESVTTSDPAWNYSRYTTGDENGILVFETDTKPVNSTNPEVSISFDAPNSVSGEVDVMTYGFAGNLTGPIYPPVGGVVVPVDKFGLLAPYIALASTILVATAATAIYVKRRKKQ